MKVLDPGHLYRIAVFDGTDGETAERRYVKRIGDKFPGNEPPPYAGTIMQEELRVLIDRAEYVYGQTPCAETDAGISLMKAALVLFEIRAKRVRGESLAAKNMDAIVHAEICSTCGHVFCGGHDKTGAK